MNKKCWHGSVLPVKHSVHTTKRWRQHGRPKSLSFKLWTWIVWYKVCVRAVIKYFYCRNAFDVAPSRCDGVAGEIAISIFVWGPSGRTAPLVCSITELMRPSARAKCGRRGRISRRCRPVATENTIICMSLFIVSAPPFNVSYTWPSPEIMVCTVQSQINGKFGIWLADRVVHTAQGGKRRDGDNDRYFGDTVCNYVVTPVIRRRRRHRRHHS